MLVMEAFSAILSFKISHGGFSYHPRCEALGLFHLMFADDMFVICGADSHTFCTIAELMRDFHLFFGLQPNLQKSASFFSGVSVESKQVLNSILNIPEAVLPVKYFGVPLISTKLSYSDCLVLKEKMLRRVQSWSNKFLSYVAQLIGSILFSMRVYWASVFILPHRIMKDIEGILNAIFMERCGIEVPLC
ncbi:hypothetical protein RHMOL_Rhmol09G0003900 [Rhododendron molle]|uniref:Uncharacterized protein n=1 Tax=Rhododendron molle TaxID=49168 RepID=A0ACC0M897_RHOML|nr:hypothetical protein RHMOL_Rhmol09G0003900 [Rhododendron molle]